VWDSIMEAKGDQLKVNLLMNRASEWADLDSYVPYQGKAVLRMKKPMRNVLVRIPKWTDSAGVTCTVNGKPAEYRRMNNGYADFGSRGQGDSIALEFPLREQVLETSLKVDKARAVATLTLAGSLNEGTVRGRVTLRGNTIVDVSPDSAAYPITRQPFKRGPLGTKEVSRFVTSERFVWD
jgi:hypothetical protein